MEKYISIKSQQYFAFNIWSIQSAKAVIDAAAQEKQNVILQTSMKAFAMLDKEELAAYVKSYGRKKNIRVFLHLDHCRKLEYPSGCGMWLGLCDDRCLRQDNRRKYTDNE